MQPHKFHKLQQDKNRFCTHEKFENVTIPQNFEHMKEQF